MMSEIYLDGNATSAVLPAAILAAARTMGEDFGNPSSTHATGLRARAILDAVRRRAARLLGVGGGRLMFNSGATEGIQTAILSALCALRERRAGGARIGSLLLYGATEHKAVPESLAHWNRVLGLDLSVRALPVDGHGRHDLDALRALAPETALLCTMAANNETGVVSDLAGIERVLQASDAYWLVDCVQALGKLALDLASTRIDYAPFSGHKLYAPKGIGMLYVRAGTPFTPLIVGGGQEAGQRSGTENMAGIAALGAVLEALEDGVTFRDHAQLTRMRARLVASLRDALPGVLFNTPLEFSLPTTLNFSVPGLSSGELLNLFDAARLRVSSGSACSSAKAAGSHVLEAMRLPHWRGAAAIRMSFGPLADEAFIDAACERIARCGAALRASCLIPSAPTADAELEEGVVRFGADGACAWLVTDAVSRACVIVDPSDAVAERLAAHVRCRRYRVAAIIHTGAPADGGAARLALLRALAGQLDAGAACDALGWPAGAAEVELGDGGRAAALTLGQQTLARVPLADGRAYYLLGAASGGKLAAAAVRFAFTGALAPRAVAAALVDPDTLLCPGRDERHLLCTSLRAEGRAPAADETGGMHLAATGLAHFLSIHPQAILVDVREAYEHAAGGGGAALSVPLSRLGGQVNDWLRGERVPLVFFCGSGVRSARAAACLRRLGYLSAWDVSGGVALGEAVAPALAA